MAKEGQVQLQTRWAYFTKAIAARDVEGRPGATSKKMGTYRIQVREKNKLSFGRVAARSRRHPAPSLPLPLSRLFPTYQTRTQTKAHPVPSLPRPKRESWARETEN